MQEVLVNQSVAQRRRIRFTAVKIDDVTDYLTSTEMTGGTWTLKITKADGTTSTPSGTTMIEVDSTSKIGEWIWEGNAADFDQPGPLTLKVQNTGGTKTSRERNVFIMVTATDRIYGTPPADCTKWNGTAVATPTTAGVPRVDVKAMEAAVLTSTAIAAGAITAAGIANGAIDLATFAADAKLGAFGILDASTAQAGSLSTTLKLQAGASASDYAYVGATVFLISGTGALQVNAVDSYNGTTKVATMRSTWGVAPDVTTTYAIIAGSAPGTAPSAAAVASAVWALLLEGSFSASDLMRLLASVSAGKVSGFDTGTLVFLSLDGTKTRLIAVDDEDVGRLSTSYPDLT